MNMNLNVIQRDGYTVLDILSDVGGLQSVLISVFAILLSIWNHNYLNSYLVSKLYKAAATTRTEDTKEQQITLDVVHTGNLKAFCIDRVWPSRLTRACCPKKRKQVLMD